MARRPRRELAVAAPYGLVACDRRGPWWQGRWWVWHVDDQLAHGPCYSRTGALMMLADLGTGRPCYCRMCSDPRRRWLGGPA